jgi:hypothetical protein
MDAAPRPDCSTRLHTQVRGQHNNGLQWQQIFNERWSRSRGIGSRAIRRILLCIFARTGRCQTETSADRHTRQQWKISFSEILP